MKEKDIINVLIAVPERDSRVFTEQLQYSLKNTPYFQVLHFYTVHTVSQIDAYVEQRKVDVVICAEDLGNDNRIGQGSIKRWKQFDNNVRIVMILFDDKRKGNKVSNFLKNGYYDAIFLNDLSPDMIMDVIVNGRTEETAGAYYFSDAAIEMAGNESDEMEGIEEESNRSIYEEEVLYEEHVEESVEEEFNPEDDVAIIEPREEFVESELEKESEAIVIAEKESEKENVLSMKQKETKEKVENSILLPQNHYIDTHMGSIKATVGTTSILLNLDNELKGLDELEGCRVLINIFRE